MKFSEDSIKIEAPYAENALAHIIDSISEAFTEGVNKEQTRMQLNNYLWKCVLEHKENK